jgi:signal transduction histidine kinase
MSHELRTPLNAIIGFSETMLKFPAMYDGVKLPNAYEADLQQIYSSGRQLLTLINDILDLAKVDAGKLDIRMERVDLSPVLRNVVSTAGGLVGSKPIQLEVDIPDYLPPVWADEARVRQVLLNLYSNAAKFTDRGSLTLMVREVEAGVRVSLKDSGIGIKPENLDVIFEEFKQAESGNRDPRSGAGLGLAISRQLCILMGGRIWAESEYGKGSTFHFILQPYQEVISAPEPEMIKERQ